MQKVMLAGRVGSVTQNTINGSNGATTVLNITLACKSDKKGQDGKPLTDWWDCSLWGKFAESMAPFITKGASLSVMGKPSVDSYTAKDGQMRLKQMCKIDDLTLMGGGQQAQQQQPQPAQQYNSPAQQSGYAPQQQQNPMGGQAQNNHAPNGYGSFESDDVPFSNYELRTLA